MNPMNERAVGGTGASPRPRWRWSTHPAGRCPGRPPAGTPRRANGPWVYQYEARSASIAASSAVAGSQHGPIVTVGGLPEPGSSKRCPARSHCSLLARPPLGVAPDPIVTQQELAQPMPSPGAVIDQVGPGPAQIPHRLLRLSRHPDRDQLPSPMQPSQPASTVTPIGLHPIPRRFGHQRRRDHLAANVHGGRAGGAARSRSGPAS